MFNQDPLLIVNPKIPCEDCQGPNRVVRRSKNCKKCLGAKFERVNLNGLWAPSPAFLVGGGPSLNRVNFNQLKKRGIASLGINNVAAYVPVKAWVFGDPQDKFHHGLFLDPGVMTFAPLGKLGKHIRAKLPDGSFSRLNVKVKDCPNTFGVSRGSIFDAPTFLTTTQAHWGRGGKQPKDNAPFKCLATMLIGIRLLHYLGCPRIYMIGVDFSRTEENQYAFEQTAAVNNNRYSHEDYMLQEIKPYLESNNCFVYNCNPESKCSAFPFVSFEEALKDCQGGVPEEPFSLSEWYSKSLAEECESKDTIDISTLIKQQSLS